MLLNIFTPISIQVNFPQKDVENVENFQLSTMIFSEHFLSVEIFLEWKWAFMSFMHVYIQAGY
jgi:hypothetical protein